jgi:glutathione synthase/RimK-type ligase-like ATP-grasp enzyme
MPDTLFSNDPRAIRRFMRERGGQIIYKPLLGAGWSDGETTWACHTVALTEGDLVEDRLLALVPGIYQELVLKAYELRVTMIGERPFAAKIHSQATEHGRVDWRRSYGELSMEPIDIDPALTRQCTALMEALGLVFGCFDFIVTPEGETIFLEVNQMGQFLFIEQYTKLPLLDAFAELLLQGRPDYRWRETSATVRYEDVEGRAAELREASLVVHAGPPTKLTNEAPEAVASEMEALA